jgi:protein TorT
MLRFLFVSRFYLWLIYLACAWQIAPVQAQNWFPVTVIADGKTQQYQPLLKAKKQWRLCALLPHGKDHYWWGVAWGLSEEAARQGVMLGIYEAGGYENADKQRAQLQLCRQKKADAFIIAAISANGFATEIRQLKEQGIPVIDLINGIDSPDVSSHSVVSFADMSAAAAGYMLARKPQQQLRLAWFPGPEGAAWVRDAETGLNQMLAKKTVSLLHAGYGPPDAFSQAGLARAFFAKEQQVDGVIANAVAAKVVAQFLFKEQAAMANKTPQAKAPAVPVVAYYANPAVIEMLQTGQISAAVTDSPVIQARIAIDLAIRLLQKEQVAKHIGPKIEVLDSATLAQYPLNRLLPPDEQWIIRRELLDLPAEQSHH